MSDTGGLLGGGFLSGIGGENGSPLEDLRVRIQERIAEARARAEEIRARFTGNETAPQIYPPMGKGLGGGGIVLLSQMPRLTKFRGPGGMIGKFGLLGSRGNRKIRPQKDREPGHHQQDISPTAQEPAIADDIYNERMRMESSPGLSVSL